MNPNMGHKRSLSIYNIKLMVLKYLDSFEIFYNNFSHYAGMFHNLSA